MTKRASTAASADTSVSRSSLFGALMSPIEVGGMRVKNRIFMSGHMTMMVSQNQVDDDQVAYYEARARGGAGLIVTEATAVHSTGLRGGRVLSGLTDDCIPGLNRLVTTCEPYDCRVVGQLFHPGREVRRAADGSAPVTYSASDVPTDRFHIVPVPMSRALISDVIAGYAATARRMVAAGMAGVEIMASHGYLPAQFLNPNVNRRTDEYGGSFDNRLRFTVETLEAVREAAGDAVVGLRLSADERSENGVEWDELLGAVAALEATGALDYLSVTFGTSADHGGSLHIAPSMFWPSAYIGDLSGKLKAVSALPVLATGRINQPQEADRLVADGNADMCGMTRALICDPELPNKVLAGEPDQIRACIGCNQACIGHEQAGYPVSCIQFPESGRERRYGNLSKPTVRKRVLIVGGGPGGMKTAAIAGRRGHRVRLVTDGPRLGGQVLLAERLPGRGEFGGLVTNLENELARVDVDIRTSWKLRADEIDPGEWDVVVLATGATPEIPELPGGSEMPVVHAWDVVAGTAEVGDNVLIADWRCDWIGVGVAELLASRGVNVTMAVEGVLPAEVVQQYIRDESNARLAALGVRAIPFSRVYGADESSVFLQNIVSGDAMEVQDVTSLVVVPSNRSNTALEPDLLSAGIATYKIGDCLAPRTAEEAVLEGLGVAAVI